MRTFIWKQLDCRGRAAVLARPRIESRADIVRFARDAIDLVRREGDAAVRALNHRLGLAAPEALAVSPAEFAAARAGLGEDNVVALRRAMENVARFHAAQVTRPVAMQVEPGVSCEQLVRPIAAVGLYVPAGTAPLPSTVIMLAVPAGIAGCPQRVVCTPTLRDGRADAAILVAAELCGIDAVFKVGGAQAIAALAYGTQSIPRVDKIFGPGNAWVTAAKQLIAADPEGAACDLSAGPSEVLVVADAGARADFIAADLLAQAEHDPLSQAILVTDDAGTARAVAAEVARQRGGLSRQRILAQSLEACRCILVPELDTALEVANAYAPEHLILQVREPRRWLARVQNAGSVFLGEWSPEPMGDYCCGTNHVLPTYGYARVASGLSIRDFLKVISVQELTVAGLKSLGPTAVTLAALEGLDGHARAVARRLEALESRRGAQHEEHSHAAALQVSP